MKCPSCETENREDAKYCKRCGFRLIGLVNFAETPTKLPPEPDREMKMERDEKLIHKFDWLVSIALILIGLFLILDGSPVGVFILSAGVGIIFLSGQWRIIIIVILFLMIAVILGAGGI